MVDENIYSRLKKIQILVCAHKKDPNIRNEYPYKAIQVGKALHPKEYFGYLCDNEGDNISEKKFQLFRVDGIVLGVEKYS